MTKKSHPDFATKEYSISYIIGPPFIYEGL
jgi:hypothetical protein